MKRKTRAAIWYHNQFGRNDGPPLYYLHNLQKLLGDENVVHLIPEGDTSRFGKFDLHFWIDYGEDGLPVDHTWKIPKDGGKTIYVCSDAHIDKGGKKYRFETAKKFDYVFFNQKRAMGEYLDRIVPGWKESKIRTNGREQVVNFLPHAAEPDAYPHTEQIKKYDVCFIGHVQETVNFNGFTRTDMLDLAFKKFPNFYFGTRQGGNPEKNMFEDAARKFNQSRIVLNCSITDDINMRVFETLCAGGFLLTNEIPTLGELFESGKHLVTYKDLDDMIVKAKYYLSNDQERERIAKAGHEFVMKNHTYKKRIKNILKIVS